jgi:hypothetical protein
MNAMEVPGKLEVQTTTGGRTTIITLDADLAEISAGGDAIFQDNAGKERVRIGSSGDIFQAKDDSGRRAVGVADTGAHAILELGTPEVQGGNKPGHIWLMGTTGNTSIDLDGSRGSIGLSDASKRRVMFLDPNAGDGYSAFFLGEGKEGKMVIRDNKGRDSITLDGRSGDMTLFDADGHRGFALLSKAPTLHTPLGDTTGMWIGADVGEGTKAGYVTIRDNKGEESIQLDGRSGDIIIKDQEGKHAFTLRAKSSAIFLGASPFDGQKPGYMAIRDAMGKDSIILNGAKGDIFLNNADCAEDFDFSKPDEIEPGTVVVIQEESELQKSTAAYDKRVAGVISGAGDYKPGIVLDKKDSGENRKPVALMGKVYCKVEATHAPIEVGDLLTTSSIPGHAMKATDPLRAFGAVIGKALRPLKSGQGMIPILIALQ